MLLVYLTLESIKILVDSVWFGGDQNNPNLQKLLAIWNNHCQKKQSILPMLKYKKNESLPQPGNYKNTNVREHTCNPNWYGLQSQSARWKEHNQHWEKQNHSPMPIKQKNPRKK